MFTVTHKWLVDTERISERVERLRKFKNKLRRRKITLPTPQHCVLGYPVPAISAQSANAGLLVRAPLE